MLRNELSLIVENDIVFALDEYYSAGQGLAYKRLLRKNSAFYKTLQGSRKDSVKVIFNYNYGTKIYTPSVLKYTNAKQMDRPYAGWNYGSFGITRFTNKTTAERFEVEVGLVGDMSGMGRLQRWWHKEMHFEKPKGWADQIVDEVVVNINYHYVKNIPLAEDADLITNTGLFGGTGNNKISQDFTLRLIKFNSLSESGYMGALLGNSQERRKKPEIYLFGGAGVDYVISNIFIEGSLFKSNPSPVTRQIVPWVFRENIGLSLSSDKNSLIMDFRFLSREIYGAGVHRYGSFTYSRRF
jgi:hypothetical protein